MSFYYFLYFVFTIHLPMDSMIYVELLLITDNYWLCWIKENLFFRKYIYNLLLEKWKEW